MPTLSPPPTVLQLWRHQTRRLQRAHLHYGHGTDCARDDAAWLIAHALGLHLPFAARVLKRRVNAAALASVRALLGRRIRERQPAAYLTRSAWFAGRKYYVDERVLIPRSPFAELIERRFQPWIEALRVRRIADIGTGSGCMALACARYFPKAHVDAVDIDESALVVARRNIRQQRLSRRVKAVQSSYFDALRLARYDMIISNPPYVGAREMAGLPAEYRHEPSVALAAGKDGMDAVRVLLREAGRHLLPQGILVVEVGNTEVLVRRRYPRLPFTWLQFERGGGGVFLLTREQLLAESAGKV
jgi:ribosomal protein L3 glutamine methyltransferase